MSEEDDDENHERKLPYRIMVIVLACVRDIRSSTAQIIARWAKQLHVFSVMLDNHTCIGRGRGLVDVDVLV